MKCASYHPLVEFLLGAAILTLLAFVSGSRADSAAPMHNESPRAYCARVGNDDTLRPPPASFAPAILRAFNIRGSYALKSTYFRCADGNVLVCWVGANLPCGKANTEKTLRAATQWCGTYAYSDFIPMYVTGHDTLYSWHCVGREAEAGAPVGKLDGRGFFERYWKKL